MKSGKPHYIIVNESGQGTNTGIATWVKEHGTAVETSEYRSGSTSDSSTSSDSSSSTGLYRLDASDVS